MDIWTWVIIAIAVYMLFGDDVGTIVMVAIIVFAIIGVDKDETPAPEIAQNVLEIQRWDCPVNGTCIIGEGNEVFLNVKVRPGATMPKEGGFIKILEPGEEFVPEPEVTEESES